VDTAKLKALLAEKASRRLEALNLYEPTPLQAPFHHCTAAEKIIRGGNRSGKSVASAVECARCVTNQDPFNKYPKEGICYVVGKQGREVGQVLWRMLGRAGAFKIIRDKVTGLWRSYRPFDESDLERAKEARPSPPLIPPRLISEIVWENKKENLPKIVRLVTGWEIHFFSGEAAPPQGTTVDFAWFDEEIEHKAWYTEVSARLIDRNGIFQWSATPQAGTEQLYELHCRAEEQKFQAEKTIEEFELSFEDNPHLTKKQKDLFKEKMSEDERLVRVHGQFAMLTSIVYPEFKADVHEVEYFDIPDTWTRYVSIDPGRQICAAMFLAVPPPDKGDYAYGYDELYIPNCDAEQFGERMREKCGGQTFQAFLIDHQEGRKVEAGSGLSIEEQYSRALRKRKIASALTGSMFLHGDSNKQAGVEACRLWLRQREEDAEPKLRIIKGRMPNFVMEIKRYRFKRLQTVNGAIVSDETDDRGRCHLMHCFRYLVQYNPRYVKPQPKRDKNYAVLAMERKRKKKDQYVRLGPGA